MRKRIQKGVCMLLLSAFLACTAAGCSVKAPKGEANITEEAADSAETDTNGAKSENTGMGRYIEKTVLETTDSILTEIHFQKMENGRIALLYLSPENPGLYYSDDNGNTWEFEQSDWMKTYAETKNYTLASALANDGTIALAYVLGDDDDRTIQHMLVDSEGTQKEILLENTADDMQIGQFCFDDTTGKLYAATHGNEIYEINREDGSGKMVLNIDGFKTRMQSNKDLSLFITSQEVYLYDFAAGCFLEDSVLQDFIEETYTRIEQNTESSYNAVVFLGEESDKDRVVYIAGEKGLHRHVIGGSTVEQIIDGSLSSLGDPVHEIQAAMMTKDQEFLIKYNDGKLVKFTYDATVSTVPSEFIRVYSLVENDTVRQAVSVYQTANPEMYVMYETGMGDPGVTREDALKKLNTQLLSGSGPDVLILDDMPMDSYIEKGILMDISDIVNRAEKEGGLFVNLIAPFYRQNALYMVPAEFCLPVFGGHESQIAGVEGYQGIASLVETLREQYPGEAVLPICSATGVLRSFINVCEPAWKMADGTVDEGKLKEFLIQSKQIYDAQMNGLSIDVIEAYNQQNENWIKEYGVSYEESMYFGNSNDARYMRSMCMFLHGNIRTPNDYNTLNSISKISGFEDTVWKPLSGQCTSVYIPLTMVGINAASKNADKAAEFLQVILGRETQRSTFYGYPVNIKSFDEQFTVDGYVDEKGAYAWIGSSSENGQSFSYEIYVPTQEQMQTIKDWIAKCKTPYLRDIVLEDTVFAQGDRYLRGETDIDTTVANIMNAVNIYMAE